MKIGLVRHFKVKHSFPDKFLLSADEVIQWFDAYEAASLEISAVELRNVSWEKCYASPLNRAIQTANYIFKGDITISPSLTELPADPFLYKKIKLPFLLWGLIVRVRSAFSGDETEAFKHRINNFLDEILAGKEQNVLIVSHVFVMQHLQQELIRRGFKGEKFKRPYYGRLYIFEKESNMNL